MELSPYVCSSDANTYQAVAFAAHPPKAAMSGQQPSSSVPPPQPQPFRFWLPYRSNVASSRQQPPPPSRPVPASPRPQPRPSAPAETVPGESPAPAVEEDIPIQAASDEPDAIHVQALDSLRLRGARPAVADLELTLSRSPPTPTAQEQSSSRDGNHGNDAKISISGFPRARLFDGGRAPYRREIEDGLKSLSAGRETPAPRPPDSGNQGCRVITLAGHNVGASMVLGNGPRDAPLPRAAAEVEGSARPAAVAANVNSNVQSVNNSAMEGSTCNAGDPGVRLDIKNAHEEPVVLAPNREEEKKPEEPARSLPPQGKSAAASGGEAAAKPPPRTRRCLRALMMMESQKTRPTACRFQCVADHAAPPAGTASDGGKSAEEGAGESTR